MNLFDRTFPRLPLVASFAVLLAATPPVLGYDYRVGDIGIEHPSLPPTPPGASSATGYLVIVNEGDEDDRLLGGGAPFADGVEVHRTTVENDVSRMRRLDEGLLVPAGSTVRLDPGGIHLMFTGLASPLPAGERRPVTLVFERAGSIDVEFAIERPTVGDGAKPSMEHDEMEHDEMEHGEAEHDTTNRSTDAPE